MTVRPRDATMMSHYFSRSTTPDYSNTTTDKTSALSVHVTISHNIQK